MDSFWSAYAEFRRGHPISVEELAFRLKLSFSTVYSWDQRAKLGENAKHGRTPQRSNRERLAEIAESAGLPKKVLAGLRPTTFRETWT